MKIGSLFTGIGGLELGVFNTVTSIAPYDNYIEWIAHPNRLPKPFTTGSCN